MDNWRFLIVVIATLIIIYFMMVMFIVHSAVEYNAELESDKKSTGDSTTMTSISRTY